MTIGKDLRLWERGRSVLPFVTRSQKLAIELMKTVGMKDSTIEILASGKILKTNCKNPLAIIEEDVSEEDKKIISDLKQNGLNVYHVLESNIMIGKQIEIECEHEVSTYESVVSSRSFLCVPNDIFVEAITFDEDMTNESNRKSVIKEYIEHGLFLANQGYLYAYVVNDDGSADFYNIGVYILNGDLLRVS